MDTINSTRLRRIFDLLGRGIHSRIEIHVAGSIPTLVKKLTFRPTGDIDLVDEVPEEIRRQRDVLRKIETDSGLMLGHVQSHDLPPHWRGRRQWFGDFGGLRVYFVDEYDIFVSKLASKKEKQQSDLGVLALELDKETARHRLLGDGRAFLDDPKLRPQIEENWRFIFQEPLFPEPEGEQAGAGGRVDQAPDEPPPSPGRAKRPMPKRRRSD